MTTINGFNGIFAPANWSQIEVGEGTFLFDSPTNTQLLIASNINDTYRFGLSTIPPTLTLLPKGKLTFTYTFSGVDSTWSYSANGTTFNPSPQNSGTISNIQINNGGTFNFRVIGGDDVNTLTITGWQFTFDEIPCFNEGSKILCFKDNEEEYIPIQNIKKGDLVKTYKHGFQRVEIIGKKKMYNLNSSKKEDRMYLLSKENYPELFEDLYITGYHSILVNNVTDEQIEKTREIVSMLFKTDDKYRLMASLDPKAEEITEEGEYTIYHFALEHEDIFMNYGVYANGLLVESNSIRNMKEYSGMEIL
jgi:hypothetical protein